MTITENLDAYMYGFGKPVFFAGSPTGLLGILDVADVDILGEDGRPAVVAGDPILLVKTSAVAALAQGAAITVDSVGYTVRSKHRVADGAFSSLGLKNA